jgi:predicted phage tail protein
MSYYPTPNLNSPYYGNITIAPSGTGTSGQYFYSGTSASTSATAVWTSVNPVTIDQNATINLSGEKADIVINGESLNETLKEIKQVLRIPSQLNRDPKLEKDWTELQEAADHYNKLLAEYKEKQKVWDTLKD